jgi:hypothetical protein
MAATYDPRGHPLLSAQAATLADSDPEAFDAWAESAEEALGLVELPALSLTDAKLARTANVHQVNAWVGRPEGRDTWVKRKKKGDQEVEYARPTEFDPGNAGLDPIASMLAERIRARYFVPPNDEPADEWAELRSLRG